MKQQLFALETLAKQAGIEPVHFAPHTVVINEGNNAEGVYYIFDHYVKILRNGHGESENFLWFARSGEIIGLTTFFHQENSYDFSAIAGEAGCVVLFIKNEIFNKFLQESRELKSDVLTMLCHRIKFTELRTSHILNKNINERIRETLMLLAIGEQESEPDELPEDVYLQYSIRDVADLVGTSLGYLRRRIKELKDENLIDYGRNWLIIRDLERLRMESQ